MKFFILIILTKLLISYVNPETLYNSKFTSSNQNQNHKVNLNMNLRLQFKSLFSINLGHLTTKNNKNKKETLTIKNLNNKERFQGFAPIGIDQSIDIGKGPIYYQGWNKYFTLTKGETNKTFKINPSYTQEHNKEFQTSHQSGLSNMNIPEEKHFYFVLTEDYMNTISSRFNEIAKTEDIVEIKSLFDVNMDNSGAIKGGIEDLGNFQEGFCFSLKGNKNRNKFKWIICSDDYSQKCELMKKIITLRIRVQNKCLGKNPNPNQSAITNIKINFDEKLKEEYQNNSTLISRWINLQEWSSCTLACGGGTQTLHRYCLRAINGPSCEGTDVMTRQCNTQPCQNVTEEVIDVKLLPTEIRIMPVSLRPQKYRKCELKEEDLDIVRFDIANLKIPPRIPSRVVMNNRTISIFESGTYDSILASYYLSELKIIQRYSEDTKKCLRIGISEERSTVMCIMCNDGFNEREGDRIEGWIKDIKDFTYNCHKREEIKKISDDDPRLIRVKLQLEEEDRILRIRRQRLLETKQKDMEHQKALKMAQLLAIRTLDKERKYEDRLEQEELMRQQKEEEDIKKEYLCEERKKSNLLKALIDKKENENKNSNDLKTKIVEIEKDLKNKITENRLRIQKKIKLLRLAHERKKNKYRQEITDMRRSLTQNVLKAERVGDENKCINSLRDNKLEEYCNVNFSSDPITHSECKSKDNFCEICCENEFGDLHIKQRNSCQIKCEGNINNNI